MLFLNDLVTLEALNHLVFQLVRLEVKRIDDIMAAFALMSVCRPGVFIVLFYFLFREGDRLHHLPEHAVGKDHGRYAVTIREIKRFEYHIDHLLDCGRRKHQYVQVPCPGARVACHVVGLRRLDAAQAVARPRWSMMISAGKSSPAIKEKPSVCQGDAREEEDVMARTTRRLAAHKPC